MEKKLLSLLILCAALTKPSLSIVNQGSITKALIASVLPENPIVVEAGAHVGSDTLEMSQLWPQGKIYAFEPVPKIYQQLVATTASCHNVHTCSVALSNMIGTAKMFVSSGHIEGSSSLFEPHEHLIISPGITFSDEIEVPTITLDAWASANNISKVDFLWLDLQGAEPIVLKASPKILKTVKAIFTEVSFVELYKDTVQYDELRHWLEGQGFIVMQEDREFEVSGRWANVLFVRK